MKLMHRQSLPIKNALPPLVKMAVMAGAKDAVNLHIQRGVDVNATDGNGRTALFFAVQGGHFEICQLLLKAGADPNIGDNTGADIFSVSTNQQRTEIDDLLRQYRAHSKAETAQHTATDEHSASPNGVISAFPSDKNSNSDKSDFFFPPNEDFNLSLWEEEIETVKPLDDDSCLMDAKEIQTQISLHTPIDTDNDWSDVDIDLPELLAVNQWITSEESQEWHTSARILVLAGLRFGRVTEQQLLRTLPDPINEEKNDTHKNRLTSLKLVLEDLGIQVEDSYAPFDPPSLYLEESRETDEIFSDHIEETADQAVLFLSNLQSHINDPLTQYVKDLGPQKRLTREEEVDLAHEISEGTKIALGSIPRSPVAIAELLRFLEIVEQQAKFTNSIDAKDTGKDTFGENGSNFSNDEAEDNDNERTDCRSSEISLDDLFISKCQTDLHQRIQTIRKTQKEMASVPPGAQKEAYADKLRDEIHNLGISNDFMEYLWRKVEADDSSIEAQEILTHGLTRSLAAKNIFATSNLRLVLWVAKKYGGLPLMDRIQEGNIGLLKAIDRFDPDRGARFSTYGIWWIRQSITRAISDTKRLIRLPVHISEASRKIERASDSLTSKLGRKPTPEELALATELPENNVRNIQKIPQDPLPITSIPDLEQKIENNFSNLFTINPENCAIHTSLKEKVIEAMACLTERETEVISLRFGLDDNNEHTLQAIGEIYGLTRERIRQIEAKALRKLSHPCRSEKLLTFMD